MTANHSIITRATSASVDEVCSRLPQAAARHAFSVLGAHDLKEKLNSKGIAFERECRVFEVCNPVQARAILDRAIDVSAALPCRISVYSDGGRTVLATIKPAALLALFGGGKGAAIAAEVEASLVRIMEEAAQS